jgi:D-glycero-alpha-D-manno-heptose-7-phosphate kinase
VIISRTPFRVSFVGGGTDLPEFYTRSPGAVISMAVDRYVYITVNRRFDETLRLSYSKTEIVDRLDCVAHPLFREALRICGVHQGIEATSIADIPSGTGLGSSSSFAVGLLHALHAYRGVHRSAEDLADEACHLELDVLMEPIGKQDQYAAAFGGLRRYTFNTDHTVSVDPVICSENAKSRLFESLLFYYVGGTRDARQILKEQADQTEHKLTYLERIRALTDDFHAVLVNDRPIEELGEILHESWLCKRELASNVTNARVDELYDAARKAGAIGGKLLGAGQAGFLMLFCPPSRQSAVRERLKDVREEPFAFEPEGSKIIYVGR